MSKIPKVVNIQIPIALNGSFKVSEETLEAFRKLLVERATKAASEVFDRFIANFDESISYNFEEPIVSLGTVTIGEAESKPKPPERGLNKYRLHWLDGKVEDVEGLTIADAFTRHGYGGGAIQALDWHEQLYFLYDREVTVNSILFDKLNNFDFVVSERWAIQTCSEHPERFIWPDMVESNEKNEGEVSIDAG